MQLICKACGKPFSAEFEPTIQICRDCEDSECVLPITPDDVKTYLLTTHELETGQPGEDVSDLTRGDLQGEIEVKQRRNPSEDYWIITRDAKGNELDREQYI